MASEAITQNDLREILSRTVGSVPSEYKKLLWTNTQGAQTSYTVTADFSNYDVIEVEFNRAGCIYSFTMANSGSAEFKFPYEGYFVKRTATISGTTMTIGNGGYYSAYNNSTVTNGATYAVPSKIYGIKYEYTQPPRIVGATDYIVDSGTEAIGGVNWTYRKWDSGIAECWCTRTASVTFGQQIYNTFYLAATPLSTAYPNIFTSINNVLCSGSHASNTGWATTVSGQTSGQNVLTTFFGWNTGGAQSITLSINLKGRWK